MGDRVEASALVVGHDREEQCPARSDNVPRTIEFSDSVAQSLAERRYWTQRDFGLSIHYSPSFMAPRTIGSSHPEMGQTAANAIAHAALTEPTAARCLRPRSSVAKLPRSSTIVVASHPAR
jgi:hypothetical protein